MSIELSYNTTTSEGPVISSVMNVIVNFAVS